MRYFRNFKQVEFDIAGTGETQTITDFFRKARINPVILDNIVYYTYYNIKNGERPDVVSYKLYNSVNYHWTFSLLNPWLVDVRKDWPMSNTELEDYVNEKYKYDAIMISSYELANKFKIGETVQGLASGALAVVLSKDVNLGYVRVQKTSGTFLNGELLYGKTSGDYMTIDSYRSFVNAPHHFTTANEIVDRYTIGAQPVTNYEYEITTNDNNTRIKVIRPEYIQQIGTLFTKLVNQ